MLMMMRILQKSVSPTRARFSTLHRDAPREFRRRTQASVEESLGGSIIAAVI